MSFNGRVVYVQVQQVQQVQQYAPQVQQFGSGLPGYRGAPLHGGHHQREHNQPQPRFGYGGMIPTSFETRYVNGMLCNK